MGWMVSSFPKLLLQFIELVVLLPISVFFLPPGTAFAILLLSFSFLLILIVSSRETHPTSSSPLILLLLSYHALLE